jgi:hypothetical protein
MDYQWHDFVGTAGAILILGTYLLLHMNRLDSKRLAYSLLNALGAALIIVSLCYDFNFSAMMVEVFWLAISLVGIARHDRGRRTSRA